MSEVKKCANCKYGDLAPHEEPCVDCWQGINDIHNKWEPAKTADDKLLKKTQSISETLNRIAERRGLLFTVEYKGDVDKLNVVFTDRNTRQACHMTILLKEFSDAAAGYITIEMELDKQLGSRNGFPTTYITIEEPKEKTVMERMDEIFDKVKSESFLNHRDDFEWEMGPRAFRKLREAVGDIPLASDPLRCSYKGIGIKVTYSVLPDYINLRVKKPKSTRNPYVTKEIIEDLYKMKEGAMPTKDSGFMFRNLNILPEIKDVIFDKRATIVFWSDGTKTVVKTQKNPRTGKYEKFDEEKGLAMAICKKAYGNDRDYYINFKRWLKKGRRVNG